MGSKSYFTSIFILRGSKLEIQSRQRRYMHISYLLKNINIGPAMAEDFRFDGKKFNLDGHEEDRSYFRDS